jgi:hypothetical protein
LNGRKTAVWRYLFKAPRQGSDGQQHRQALLASRGARPGGLSSVARPWERRLPERHVSACW